MLVLPLAPANHLILTAFLTTCFVLEFVSWLLSPWLGNYFVCPVLGCPCPIFHPCLRSDLDHLPDPSSLTPESWACHLPAS